MAKARSDSRRREVPRLGACVTAQSILQREALPRGREIDVVYAPAQAQTAGDFGGELAEQLFGHLHELTVVGVGHVEFEHREFGIVLRGHAFVAEHPRQLEDALEPADHQPLEVELGSDPQIEVEVEGVVVRDERPCGGAPGDELHHRSLDLDELARGEVFTDLLQDHGALAEDGRHLRIGDQVEIALAVADLRVGEPVPLFGKRPQRLGEHAKRACTNRELAGARAKQLPFDRDDVADVGVAVRFEAVPEIVALDVDLQATPAVLQIEERGLSEVAQADHASPDTGLGLRLLERFGVHRAKPLA